jgi:flagellar biosynthesis protein FlhB
MNRYQKIILIAVAGMVILRVVFPVPEYYVTSLESMGKHEVSKQLYQAVAESTRSALAFTKANFLTNSLHIIAILVVGGIAYILAGQKWAMSLKPFSYKIRHISKGAWGLFSRLIARIKPGGGG